MIKTRKPKEYKPKPSGSGVMACDINPKHRWDVVDQNPERVVVPCPVCGGLTSVNRLEKQ
jgi:hypothetical protein